MFFLLMFVAGLQAAGHNTLGVYYPGQSEYTMSVVPWRATKEDMDFRVQVALMKEEKFPIGDWVCMISDEIDGKVKVTKYTYEDGMSRYVVLGSPENLDLKKLDLNNCSYVVYNMGGSNLNHCVLGDEVLSKIYKKEIPCVVNYTDNKRAIVSTLMQGKNVKFFETWEDAKSKFFVYGVGFCALVFIYCIEPLTAILL